MRRSNVRIVSIFLIMALMFVIISANVFAVSVLGYHINSDTDIKKEVNGIHVVNETLYAKRGEITDVNGKVLAYDASTFTLYANINENTVSNEDEIAYVKDKELTASSLAPILDKTEEEILEILNSEALQVEFGFKGKYLTLSQKESIDALNLPGLGFSPSISRFYPYESLAADIIGFTIFNEQTSHIDGQQGIEYLYDDMLTGTNGFKEYLQTADGIALAETNNENVAEKNGKKIKLTLDVLIQETLESTLAGFSSDSEVQASESWGAVMDIETGRIIAIAEYPTYNLNDRDIENYYPRSLLYEYEPGSTMKTFTVAAAIDQGVFPGEAVYDNSPYYVDYQDGRIVRSSTPTDITISNASSLNSGMNTYNQGYIDSANVMITELLSQHLDPEVFKDYLTKLGFFEAVETDKVPGSEGYLPSSSGHLTWDYPIEKNNNGFGQGSTVTMMQMLQAHTAILSDGTMVKPYLIDSVTDVDTNEVIHEGTTQVVNKPFKEETTKEMQRLMRLIVTEGTGQRFNVDSIETIAKTGTAEMVIDGTYSSSEYIFSNVIAFPAENPKYMVYTAYQANYYVNNINASANYINQIVDKVVNVYGLNKDGDTNIVSSTNPSELSNYINKTSSETIGELTNKGLNHIVIGDGDTVINQYPLANTSILPTEKIFIYTGSQNITMPNMVGWSQKEVQTYANISGINIKMSGSGYVTQQNIAEGTVINLDTAIELTLQ